MSLTVDGHQIQRVLVIDDEPLARESYGEVVEDLNLNPILVDDTYHDLQRFALNVKHRGDAAICDHHLRKQQYAAFNGADFVAYMYDMKFPALLCTRREEADIDEIRPYRRNIPVLLNPRDLTPENIQAGFNKCVNEFNEKFLPSRKPWRALVRVDGVDEENKLFYVIIPGWDAEQVIRLRLQDLPSTVKEKILSGTTRIHAKVNLGAEANEDIFFYDWENQ